MLPAFNAATLTRANTMDFKPPMPNRLIQRLFNATLPLLFNGVFGGLSVSIDRESLDRLKQTKGQRCLILPNHPTEWDPCVVFDIAKRLNEAFYFVAAREVFDYSLGIRGWLFQRLGVYSLVRGTNDRASLKTSMSILAENKGRLVIFIEGEISSQNESLLPLESGVIQLAFMALNDCYKSSGKSLESLPSLFITPLAIRYDYHTEGLSEAIDTALTQLESATHTVVTAHTRHERLLALSQHMLLESAHHYGIPAERLTGLPLTDQVKLVSNFMLTKLEQMLNLPLDERLSYLDRIRRLRNLLDKLLGQHDRDEDSLYQKRLFDQKKATLQQFYPELTRIVNFVAIYDGYLTPIMSDNRTVELIRRLEKEVFGVVKLSPPRTARAQVMPPIDLKTHFEMFLADKAGTVQAVVTEVEQAMFAGLH